MWTTAEEGLARHQALGATPEGALQVWLEACLLWNREEAAAAAVLTALTIPLRDEANWHRKPSHQFFVERLRAKPWIFQSYALGAAHDNGYVADPFQIAVAEVRDATPRGMAVFVKSGGADSPRPAYLKRSSKSGLYYVAEYVNLYVEVRKPVASDAETFE